MNKVMLMGRLTRDPEVRYSKNEQETAVARYTLAVDRRFKRDGDEQTADFISCVAFGRAGEFAERYFRRGIKIVVTGRPRQEVIRTRMARRYTQRMSLWRNRSLQRERTLPAAEKILVYWRCL